MYFIILAAGVGSRLKNLTKDKPKTLIEFKKKSLLDYQLSVIKRFGFLDIFLITGFKKKMFDKYTTYIKEKFHNSEYKKTNMVYSLYKAKSLFDGTNDIIISYGDIIYEESILKKLISDKSKISVVIDLNWKKLWSLRMEDPKKDIESLKLNSKGFITDIGQKVKSLKNLDGQFIGLIKINKRFTKKFFDIFEKQKLDKRIFMTDYLQILINNKILPSSVKIKNGWIEFDTLSDIQKYCEAYRNGKLDSIINIKELQKL